MSAGFPDPASVASSYACSPSAELRARGSHPLPVPPMTQSALPAAPPFIAVVPARLASTRLPNKPLADIGGQPIVVRVAGRALESGAQHVLIASDAQSVLDVARAHGIEAMLTRADHPSGTDRLAGAGAQFGWSDDTIVVNGQGDEPLIDPALVPGVASHLAAN